MTLDALSGEESRRLYGMLKLEVAPTPEGLEIAGGLSMSEIQMVTRSLVMSEGQRFESARRLCLAPSPGGIQK
jgi:hypothetical protein